MNKITIAITTLLAIWLSGCSSTPQHSMEMGGSVNQMISMQTLNPDAPLENGTELKSDLDGQIGENILHTYRTSTGEPEKVQNEIKISIGN
ncbi:hypothetical protein [Amphritea balenae]|uniref:Uncharacterized protein n=1 Tax=Amphritea balenae TaxID=452629 RepID=A0A3P1SVW4_9GAMM|nr:hypothetical protein [Amphritea balenae]RRD01178.1 hypothetical protein EHS89_01040 [Amphritea balenae]GGK59284.1 hypothetical protein GCM10007941_06890 [Amphritea balenae]